MRVAEGLVFDFDGLILDTESPILAEWQAEYARRSRVLDLALWQSNLGSHGRFDPCDHLVALGEEPFDADALRLELRTRILARCDAEPVRPGVARLLAEARAAGLPCAVASSSSAAWVRGWLDRHGLTPSFAAVCTRDDVTAVKPEPDLYLLAAERLGARPERCLALEDAPNGLRAARAAGLRCVVVSNAVTHGLPTEGADLVLPSLDALPLAEMMRRVGLGLPT